MSIHKIFEEFKLGDLDLKNRFMMAPLTRSRSNDSGVATDLMAKYYSQRAGAGIIISEATNISPEAYGYIRTPGIFTKEQAESWKKVTKAVHDKNGLIICQLWHCGRISHNDIQPDNKAPVSASSIKADAQAFTNDGRKDCSEPRALTVNEIRDVVNEYKQASIYAKEAGFDGVEIHAANGYLLQQFMATGSNKRNDEYGGVVENRMRIVLDVIDECVSVWGAGKVGIRLSPVSPFNDMNTEDPQRDYEYLINKINERNIAYIHLIHGATMQNREVDKSFNYQSLKDSFNGSYVDNNCLNIDLAKELIDKNKLDIACFGRKFIANPDLVKRFKEGAELNEPNPDTFYTEGAEGYTDYPFLN